MKNKELIELKKINKNLKEVNKSLDIIDNSITGVGVAFIIFVFLYLIINYVI